MKKFFIALAVGLIIVSCGNKNESGKNDLKNANFSKNQNKETLVASVPPLKWIVQRIAGNEYNVISVIQPNMNHELFEPKTDDLIKLEKSKLFFTYDALNFEEKITSTINDKNKVLNVLNGIDPHLFLEDHDHDEHGGHHHDEHEHNGKFDPHVWFSLEMMPKVAENVKNKLIETYPNKKDKFEQNYNNFLKELESFKKEISEKMSKKTKKYFMIYHPALEYFLKDYGIKEIAIENEGKEPSAKQIQEIISEAKAHGISTILVQPQFPKQSIDIISKEIPNAKISTFNTDEENVFENLRKFVNSLQ
ncbi:metal ABC transporter substrate-binding protein [Leptotrichia sp. oral taxon 847]|uniref:metal ABC transporter substrate-binding protein n=1 Tax=Leptotrichia sp. oral taxon 847 TaxID=1785996 RepID=UPI0007681839|nr:zinc ABC transporter substrate-binding protein [Leptotrichia sp. oral taxon 847]AMD95559.1 ABC transporter substrate-binding protein [Leptotrichia sp. oral taxon 847]